MLAKDAVVYLAMIVSVGLIITSFVFGLGYHAWFWAADTAWIGFPLGSWADRRLEKMLVEA